MVSLDLSVLSRGEAGGELGCLTWEASGHSQAAGGRREGVRELCTAGGLLTTVTPREISGYLGGTK